MSAAPSTKYDLLILGSGQAGNPLASAFAKQNKRVALVERREVGGTCVNYGCTPTKTMVASAEAAFRARTAGDFGVHTGSVEVDLAAVVARKDEIVGKSRGSSEKAFGQDPELIRGEARFSGPKQVTVALHEGGERVLTADHIVIDTGLSADVPAIDGMESVPHLDNVTIMQLSVTPGHLIILGGGYIGLEFAQMFRRFGAGVTIIQESEQLLPHEDEDVAQAMAEILREDGITVLLRSKPTRVAPRGDELTVSVQGPDSQEITGTHLLVATGRKPNTRALHLEAAGIALDEKGFIKVNDRLETSAEGIFAVGDVKGGPAFTHISYDDFRILQTNLLEGGNRGIKGRQVPYCVFTDPELGRIGMGEKEASKAGVPYRVACLPMSKVARAFETNQTRGFIKALVDPESKQILGAAVLGAQGGEIMAMLQIAMLGRLPYPALKDAILAHPTFAECLNKLFMSLDE